MRAVADNGVNRALAGWNQTQVILLTAVTYQVKIQPGLGLGLMGYVAKHVEVYHQLNLALRIG